MEEVGGRIGIGGDLGQLLGLYLAIARGLDPETPRWIQKVTLTS